MRATITSSAVVPPHPSVFVLAEIFWDDDAYGEDLPKAALFCMTRENMAKVEQIMDMINAGMLADPGATVAMHSSEMVFLRDVHISDDGILGSVPGFFDATKDKVLFLSDTRHMENADSDSCRIYEIDNECQQHAGIKIRRYNHSGFTKNMCISIVGACSTGGNDWGINGFLHSWPELKAAIHAAAPALDLPCVPDLEKGLILRNKALALLQEAQQTDGLKPFTITHTHSFGESTYVLWAADSPTEEQATAVLDCEFEPDREESLAIEDHFTLEEMTGVAATARLQDLMEMKKEEIERPRG